jgi:hypothetical protein
MRVVILALLLAGCATTKAPPPEPVIVTKEVLVPVQVPCAALKALGAEPVYPDSDAALKAASSLFERTKLLLQGRLLRTARLAEYAVAKASCL